MSEHDEQWLREGLASAVPEPPTNPDRARAAERLARRRRRTTATAVIGTAGAVAAAAVLTVTLTSGDNGDKTSIATDPPAAVECPAIEIRGGVAEGTALDEPDPDAPDAVPEGATSARLCQGPGTTFEVPGNALVDGVDDLVAAVNDLEVIGPPEICTDELGPGFRIAFGYDDGSTFVVSGRLYGCQTLVVGSTYRADPEAAQAAFLALLAEQQGSAEESSADVDAADPSCSDSASGTPAADIGLTAAILCIDDGSGNQLSAEIAPADLELLVGDMAVNQSVAQLRCGAQPPFPTMVGADDAGNVIVIPSECGTSFWRLPNGMAWMPSKEAVAILDQLVSAAR